MQKDTQFIGASGFDNQVQRKVWKSGGAGKVIYPKYPKHWPYTVAHTKNCVCSKMLNDGLNHAVISLYPATYNELYIW